MSLGWLLDTLGPEFFAPGRFTLVRELAVDDQPGRLELELRDRKTISGQVFTAHGAGHRTLVNVVAATRTHVTYQRLNADRQPAAAPREVPIAAPGPPRRSEPPYPADPESDSDDSEVSIPRSGRPIRSLRAGPRGRPTGAFTNRQVTGLGP